MNSTLSGSVGLALEPGVSVAGNHVLRGTLVGVVAGRHQLRGGLGAIVAVAAGIGIRSRADLAYRKG